MLEELICKVQIVSTRILSVGNCSCLREIYNFLFNPRSRCTLNTT